MLYGHSCIFSDTHAQFVTKRLVTTSIHFCIIGFNKIRIKEKQLQGKIFAESRLYMSPTIRASNLSHRRVSTLHTLTQRACENKKEVKVKKDLRL